MHSACSVLCERSRASRRRAFTRFGRALPRAPRRATIRTALIVTHALDLMPMQRTIERAAATASRRRAARGRLGPGDASGSGQRHGPAAVVEPGRKPRFARAEEARSLGASPGAQGLWMASTRGVDAPSAAASQGHCVMTTCLQSGETFPVALAPAGVAPMFGDGAAAKPTRLAREVHPRLCQFG